MITATSLAPSEEADLRNAREAAQAWSPPHGPVPAQDPLTRASVRELIGRAAERIIAGGRRPPIHQRYVVPALELLEDVETRAVLAATDDPGALAAIECLMGKLDSLNAALEQEDCD